MATGLELWLVRHGETTSGAERKLAGWHDPPLTAKGRDQARALRPFLNGQDFIGVWSSDLVRTQTTARLAWGEAQPDQRLREMNFGALENQPYEEIDRRMGKLFMEFRSFTAPEGESIDAVRTRVLGFLDQLPPGRHLLFVHGGIIRLLTQDLGIDRFVATSTVVGLDWPGQQVLFVREPES